METNELKEYALKEIEACKEAIDWYKKQLVINLVYIAISKDEYKAGFEEKVATYRKQIENFELREKAWERTLG